MRGQVKDIYFRADGGSKIGLGHVIRSLALADMLKSQYNCHFIIRNPDEFIRTQILKTCQSIIELRDTVSYSEEAVDVINNVFDINKNSIVVLDGYSFDTNYQNLIKPIFTKVVCIDDIHQYSFVSDVVLNHSGGFSQSDYCLSKDTSLYCGLEYALLRLPFRNSAKNRNYSNWQKGHFFVCLGGSDPRNDILDVLNGLNKTHEVRFIHIVVGSGYVFIDELTRHVNTLSKDSAIHVNLSSIEMNELMKTCPYAVTSASSISYEFLSTGGILFLKVIADNQRHVCQYLTNNNLALSLDQISNIRNINESKMLSKQSEIFDGNQDKRILAIFNSLNK